MNPFDVSRFGVVNILAKDLSSLPINMSKSVFLERVFERITEKMEGANVLFTLDAPFKLPNMKELHIHNSRDLEARFGAPAEWLGATIPDKGVIEVNVDDVFSNFEGIGGIDPVDFAESVGTVCSHEVGHLYLPGNHSAVQDSLMADGTHIAGKLGDGGDSLVFTDLQLDMMNVGIAAQQDPALFREWQNNDLAGLETLLDPATTGADAVGGLDFGGIEESFMPDPGVWGDFDPSVIDSISGLGDLSSYGELAGAFDLEGLEALSNDGFMEMFGDFDPSAIGDLGSNLPDGGEGLFDLLGELLSGIFG